VSIVTLVDVFTNAVAEFARPDAFLEKRGDKWVPISTEEFAREVAVVGEALVEFGMKPGDRVAIMSENRYQWAVVDFATLTRGGVVVPVYPTLPANQMATILSDSGASFLFTSTPEQTAKAFEIGRQLQHVRVVVPFEPVDVPSRQVMSYTEFVDAGARVFDARGISPVEACVACDEEDLATLIYTSGTTGTPKGVMLTHRNLVTNTAGVLERFSFTPEDSYLSFLPISHVFERTCGHYAMIRAGVSIAYASSIESVAEDAQTIHPTIMIGVPRFFEKFHARIVAALEAAPPSRRRVFNWAVRVGRKVVDAEIAGEAPTRGIKYRLASSLVYSKLNDRMGGRLRAMVSGSAPLRRDLILFFHSVGIPIFEGYGLTETSPVITVNYRGSWRPGAVGQTISDVDVRVAEDGEIEVRGPNVTRGYFRNPQATEKLFTDDGWLCTGDIGEVDEDGYVFITDRKKDLIKTAGGKFVAPQPMENRLRQNRYIADAMIIGDTRKFCSAVIIPDFEGLAEWMKENGIEGGGDRDDLCRRAEVQHLFQEAVDAANDGLARHETIKKFLLMSRELTIADGSLTPSLKMKRRVIEERLETEIDKLYESAS
jgi:long-chain acyl-CoA synthetase